MSAVLRPKAERAIREVVERASPEAIKSRREIRGISTFIDSKLLRNKVPAGQAWRALYLLLNFFMPESL
jgi:hypothetical protein